MRLKPTEVKAYRLKILKKQNYICPLCNTKIEKGDDTLDHDHGTGHVRRVLHRNCNQIEGRILAWARRGYCDATELLHNISEYWSEDYSSNPYHPNHKTEIEKQIFKLKKRMRTLKTERKKQEYRDKIEELKRKEKNG